MALALTFPEHSGGQKAPVRRRGDQTRQAILDAALDLFEEHGYATSTVPDIARQAGIATGTIYIYFKTKETLVNALYQYWRTDFNNKVYSGLEDIDPGRDQLLVVWRAMANYARTHRKVMAFLELHRHAGYLDAESWRLEAVIYKRAESWVERGIRLGVLGPQSADVAIGLVWGALTGMLKFSVDRETGLSPEIIDAYGEALWQALKP